MRGCSISGPIRDESPCFKCKKPKRHTACHENCKEHSEWKAEVERVNQRRREYAQMSGLGWRPK